jgi:hypothetical protein
MRVMALMPGIFSVCTQSLPSWRKRIAMRARASSRSGVSKYMACKRMRVASRCLISRSTAWRDAVGTCSFNSCSDMAMGVQRQKPRS